MQRSVTGGGGEGGGGKMLFVLVPTLAGIITALSLLACCLWRRKRLHERARSAGDDISMTTIQRMRSAHKEAKSGSSNSSTAGTESGSEAADSSAPAQALRMVRAPEIPESEITLGRMLGRGGSGTVRAGTWLGMAVAVKKLDERTSGDQQQRSNLEQEAALLSSLRHPCVCQLFGICLAPNGLAVVMELLDCSLHQLLSAPSKHISASLAYRIAHETAQGIAYLHRNTVLHRDIKPGNVVLDQLQHAKVCDFGLSRAFTVSIEPGIMVEGFGGHGSSCCVGTLRYMAPEVMQQTEQQVTIRYNEPCDVYSFGMLLWELVHREPPFAGSAGIQVALEIVPAGLRPQLQLPKDLAALGPLITSCWHVDPAQRPTMSACCEQLLTLFQAMEGQPPNPAEVGHLEVLAPSSQSSSSQSSSSQQQQPDQRGPDSPAECTSSDRTPAPVLVPDVIAAGEPV